MLTPPRNIQGPPSPSISAIPGVSCHCPKRKVSFHQPLSSLLLCFPGWQLTQLPASKPGQIGGVESKHLIFSSTSISLAPSEMTSPLNWDIKSEQKQEAQRRCGAAPVTAHPCAVSPLPRSINHQPGPCMDTCELPALSPSLSTDC